MKQFLTLPSKRFSLMHRIVLIVLAVCLLGSVLVSCGQQATTPTVKNPPTLVEIENQQLNISSEICSLAWVIRYHEYPTTGKQPHSSVDLYTQLVAALNGYDTSSIDFSKENPWADNNAQIEAGEIKAEPERAGEYAYNVLVNNFFPAGIAENSKGALGYDNTMIFLTDYQDMTPDDVQALVKCFQEEVPTTEARDFLGYIMWGIGLVFGWLIQTPGFGLFVLGALYFAILVELVMLPISIIQQKNARKQARLRPKEMAIRHKYAGRKDNATQQKIAMEIQELYQKEGYNPMSAGCLPLLITLPIIMALYSVVIDPLTYILGCSDNLSAALTTFATAPRAAGGLGMALGANNRGTIEILSNMSLESLNDLKTFQFFSNGEDCFNALSAVWDKVPNFKLFGLNFGLIPSLDNLWLMIVPVLTFVVYFFSMKINRKFTYQPTTSENDKAAGCSNSMMDWMMPLLSVSIAFFVPAAVGLYWIFKSIIGVGKQFIMSKVMPMPVFTEEDYKAAIKEMQGKDKPRKRSGNGESGARSLHRIDDEDYETEAQPAKKAPKKNSAMIDRAAIKEDRPHDEEVAQADDEIVDEPANEAEANDTPDNEQDA